MPLPLTSDLATIMNLDEFAVSATYQRKNAAGDTVIKLIFDNETVPIDAGGFAQVHQEQPRATVPDKRRTRHIGGRSDADRSRSLYDPRMDTMMVLA